uniref:Uncharacterized protein n=1 Tax=Lactuca sativa TaxID=4236 RepID=A0A9R1WFR2_LACSA|nr:hypothetical protein LSAT_V11C200091490 [Lactuca sativa]
MANQEVNNGLPLTFTPVNPKKGVIRESTDLNIIFLAASTCIQSNVWMLEEYDGQLIVTSHGVAGNPGQETIKKYEDHYKLMFCSTVCDICKPVFGNIGVVIAKNGSRRLAISEVPLKIIQVSNMSSAYETTINLTSHVPIHLHEIIKLQVPFTWSLLKPIKFFFSVNETNVLS